MLLNIGNGHIIQLLIATDGLLQSLNLGVFLVLICRLHIVKRFLLRINGVIRLVVGKLLLKLCHLFLQLDFLRLRITAVIQGECIDLLLELGDLLHLICNLILVLSLLLGGIQRLLTEVNDIAIGVFEVFQCVNLLLNSVLQHIHDVLEDVVNPRLHVLQLFSHLLTGLTRNLTNTGDCGISERFNRLNVVQGRRVLLVVQVAHSVHQFKLCIGKAERSIRGVRSGV